MGAWVPADRARRSRIVVVLVGMIMLPHLSAAVAHAEGFGEASVPTQSVPTQSVPAFDVDGVFGEALGSDVFAEGEASGARDGSVFDGVPGPGGSEDARISRPNQQRGRATGSPAGSSAGSSGASGAPVDPVRRWLNSLDLKIPGPIVFYEEVPVLKNMSFTITNVECKDIDLAAIPSSFDGSDKLALDVTGLAVKCEADLAFRKVKWPHTHGSLHAVADISKVGLSAALRLTPDAQGDKLAGGANLTLCALAFAKDSISLKFSGSAAAGVLDLNWIRTKITSLITSNAGPALCGMATPLVDNDVSWLVGNASATIRRILTPQPPVPAPVMPVGRQLLDFQASAAVEATDKLLDELLSPAGINAGANLLVNLLAQIPGFSQSGDGTIAWDPTPGGPLARLNFTAAVGDLANVTISLTRAAVGGLTTTSMMRLLQPVGPHTLQTETGLGQLTINASLGINVTIGGSSVLSGGSLHEDLDFFLEVANNSLSLTSVMGVDVRTLGSVTNLLLATGLDKLGLDDAAAVVMSEPVASVLRRLAPKQGKPLYQPPPPQLLPSALRPAVQLPALNLTSCLAAALPVVNFTGLQLNTTLVHLSITAAGGGGAAGDSLEKNIDTLLDNAVLLFSATYEPAIPALINAAAAAARPQLNTLIADALARANNVSAPCVALPPASFVTPNISAPHPLPEAAVMPLPQRSASWPHRSKIVDFNSTEDPGSDAGTVEFLLGVLSATTTNTLLDFIGSMLLEAQLFPQIAQSTDGVVVWDPGAAGMSVPNITVPMPQVNAKSATLSLRRLSAAGLDSWSFVELFQMIGSHTLQTKTALQSLRLNMTLGVAITTFATPTAPASVHSDEATFFLDLSSMKLELDSLLMLDAEWLANAAASLVDLAKLMLNGGGGANSTSLLASALSNHSNHSNPNATHNTLGKCVAEMVPGFALSGFSAAAKLDRMGIVEEGDIPWPPHVLPPNVTIPPAVKQVLRDVANLTIALFDGVFRDQPQYAALVPYVAHAATQLGRSALNKWVGSTLGNLSADESTGCGLDVAPPAPPLPPVDTKWTTGHAATVSGVIGAVAICGLLSWKMQQQGTRLKAHLLPKQVGRVNASGAAGVSLLMDDGERARALETSSEQLDRELIGDAAPLSATAAALEGPLGGALAMHPLVDNFERYSVPIIIWGTVAIYISANTGIGAGVGLILDFNGAQSSLPSLFNFTLQNSVHDMWFAKVYALSLIIAVFSGAWPYLKLMLMMFAWVSPTRLMSTKRRERLFMALDALGKWSLIDMYVLLMMMVAFRFHVEVDQVPGVDLVVDVIVEPGWGFYGFLLATCINLTLSHVMLAIHRRVTSKQLPQDTGAAEALCNHEYTLLNKRIRFTGSGKVVVTLLLLGTIATIIGGCLVRSFEFDFKGAGGVAFDLVNSTTYQEYSVLSLGQMLPTSTTNGNSFPVRWLQVTFYMFTMVTPVLHIVVLIVLWLKPLKLSAQRMVMVACEVLNAWSALDVFCIAIIAALLEIGQFVQFIIGGRCDLVNELIVNATKVSPAIAKLIDGDPQCFDVIATLDTGCWTLFIASCVQLAFGQLVMRTCHKALRERMEHLDDSASGLRVTRASSDADKLASLLREQDVERERNPTRCRRCIRSFCLSFSSFVTRLGFLQSEDLTPEEVMKRKAAGKY